MVFAFSIETFKKFPIAANFSDPFSTTFHRWKKKYPGNSNNLNSLSSMNKFEAYALRILAYEFSRGKTFQAAQFEPEKSFQMI